MSVATNEKAPNAWGILRLSDAGAGGGTRTHDQLFTKQLLCQLSYTGSSAIVACTPVESQLYASADESVAARFGAENGIITAKSHSEGTMTEQLSRVPNLDALGFQLPTPEEGLAEAKRRLAHTFRPNEMVWLVAERYDSVTPAWNLDIVRQGALGRWVRQRARFDEQAQVLYYLGETPLTDAQFREVRRANAPFPIAELRAS